MAELLVDRYIIGPLLKFLKNTEVEIRDDVVEREIEWEQRRDQAGEDQLEDL